ncbi:MAG: glycosyl hydrolase 108 family protein [Fervidobacterium sp.]|uniref:Glycosyl hydrolase 108 n=1 Tax=Fervidobacterium gondwanense DSM 13020 TaxID=1121883 RepID=A0A1M7THZ8_FERGO|nr:glycosyl hydrolase 108 family protein [Fervidobacterium gondwanense]UXF01784.1 hypothetical protein IB67_09760 [Fervidobacterium riparium]SHN70301.1 Glycosyl hydrolase 108 [Fervidobacterium gondwanense DSM 13020]
MNRAERIILYLIILGLLLFSNAIIYQTFFYAPSQKKAINLASVSVENTGNEVVSASTDGTTTQNVETPDSTQLTLKSFNELKKDIENLRKALYNNSIVEYVIYSVVDFEGSTLTFDELGGFTKYGISSKHNPDVNIFNLTRDRAYYILYTRYYVPNRIYEFQSIRLQVAMMHMCTLFGKKALTIAYSVLPRSELIYLKDSDPRFPWIVEKLRTAFSQHARQIGTRYPQYLKGWLNRINKVFYIG